MLISISLLLVSIHTLQSLIEIRRAFLNFQLIHVPKCTFIPTDIRESYNKYFLADEKHYYKYRSDEDKDYYPFVWITSAIRRGLRDSRCDEESIVYLPQLAIHPSDPNQNIDKEDDGDDVSVYGDEEELEQTIFDLMKELHEDTFTPIVKVDNQHDDTYEIVSMKTSPDVDMEDMAVTPNKENLVSEDSVESTVRQEKSNYVVEEEDHPNGFRKKQKLENEVSDVDSVSSCGNVYHYFIIMSYFNSSSLTISTLQLKQDEQEPSPHVTPKRETEVSDKLKTLFYNCYGIEEVELKNTKSRKATSIYNGVYRERHTVFDSKFLDIRLGRFILETDAALVDVAAVRAQSLKEHYEKINFAT